MDAKVIWQGRMSFNGRADSGLDIPLGTDPSVGGDNDGARPMELFAIGLAGCTAMDVISILQKKRMGVTEFEVQAHVERADEHPKVFTHIVLEYVVYGHEIKEDAVVRAIELSATRYCPAHAMMEKVCPIEIKYHIYEEKDGGDRSLVVSGEFTP
ncbi:MAG: OsmC family protein [Anaerolineales bacterium]|nr:OsmC family protein [Anaerolineales bacterium]